MVDILTNGEPWDYDFYQDGLYMDAAETSGNIDHIIAKIKEELGE